MSIYRVNQGKSVQQQIKELNDMILELNGRASKGEFNKKELDSIFTNASISDREYLRDVGLGNTASTYGNWSHVHAEAGYSIWKIAVSNYSHNANNELYFNDALVENRGAATSEAITAFDEVKMYNGDSASGYTDHNTEAATEGGTEFELMDSANDYLYIGHSTTFFGFKIEFETQGRGYDLAFEYWNGSAWTDLEASALTVDDQSNNFTSDGRISWDDPGDWATTTVDSDTKYWIRISTTSSTGPTTTAQCYLIIPDTSAIALLALSSSELLNADWAWCYYNNQVYVTIRNSGNSSYEGTYFITSSSSDANKENFFVHNNGDGYELNHIDSTYSP